MVGSVVVGGGGGGGGAFNQIRVTPFHIPLSLQWPVPPQNIAGRNPSAGSAEGRSHLQGPGAPWRGAAGASCTCKREKKQAPQSLLPRRTSCLHGTSSGFPLRSYSCLPRGSPEREAVDGDEVGPRKVQDDALGGADSKMAHKGDQPRYERDRAPPVRGCRHRSMGKRKGHMNV